MQRVDQTADDSTPCWGEDTIYCEAICQPKDILYEGSDDDDYDSPTSRRLRCEAAGQRFLDGIEPFLLTATLKGPFDKASGWVNPWRSKYRTTQGSHPISASRERPAQQQRLRRTVSIPESTQDETQNSLDCHLPSPESLKQASVVNSHPFLLEEDLIKVQNWRRGVEPVSSTKDRFWVTTPQGNESARKRKARGSDWLKKLATKRRRTSLMESGSVNTPVPRRSHTDPTLLQKLIDDNPSASFDSGRGQHPSSASQPVSRRPVSKFRATVEEEYDEDELTTFNHDSILSSTQPNTSVRRISPRREIQPNRDDRANLEDELSQEQIAAAATLSSPVSQRSHPKSSLHHSSFQVPSSQIPLEQQSPTRRKASAPSQLPRDPNGHPTTARHVNDVDGQEEKELEAFESQKDQSFCFKMRPKLGDHAEHSSTLDPTATYNEEHTWSGLSSEGSLSSHSTDEALVIAQSTASIENDADSKIALAAGVDMNDDDSSSSSDLSSLLSRYFEGFHTPGPESEDHMDVDTTETTEDDVQEVIEVASQKRPNNSSKQGGEPTSVTSISQHSPPPALPTIQHISPIELQHMSESGDTETSSDSSLTTLDDNDVNEMTPSKNPKITFEKPKRAVGNSITPTFIRGALLLKSSVRQCMSSPLPKPRTMGSAPPILRTKPTTITTAQQDDLSTASEESSEEDSEDDDGGGNRDSPTASTSAPEPEIEVIPQSPILEHTSHSSVPSVDQDANNKVGGSQEEPQITEEKQELGTRPRQELQGEIASNGVEKMDLDPVESQALPASQQSPWAGTKLSQVATLAIEHLSQEEEASGPANAPQVEERTTTTSPTPQSPWAGETTRLPLVNEAIGLKEEISGVMSPTVEFASITKTPTEETRVVNPDAISTSFMTPRPSTPEPQFTVKSFASFMSPSPERRLPRQGASWRGSGSRLPSTQGILASAMKNPWTARSNRSDRRVSWKPLPNESEGPATPEVASSIQVSSEPKERASSPPPMVPVADLPTSQSEKFHDHFKAVIRRRNNHALLPTESQRTLGSPDPQAMAEKFIEADDVINHHSEETMERADTESLPKSSSFKHSQDSVDIVEDIFREMSDYLETWNVDTELDNARRGSSVQTPRVEPSAQSPW